MPRKDWSHIGPVRLVRRCGQVWDFDSLDHLVVQCSHLLTAIGDGPLIPVSDPLWDSLLKTPEYIVRDECDLTIPLWKIEEIARANRVWDRIIRGGTYYARKAGYDYERHYRCGPVPLLGRYRRGRSMWRYPRTTQEQRYLCDDRCDEVGIRIRRKRYNTPNAWDDRIRSHWDVKNWKKFRKTQYKT